MVWGGVGTMNMGRRMMQVGTGLAWAAASMGTNWELNTLGRDVRATEVTDTTSKNLAPASWAARRAAKREIRE